jgi:hypothetical protein
MTTVNTKSSRKTKQKPPSFPPTVLTITLNPDKTGTLIVKRGDLAALSHFTYRDMNEIFTAIQQGAAQLAEVEKNPPPAPTAVVPTASAPHAEPSATAAPTTTAADPIQASPPPTASAAPLSVALTPGTVENDSTVQLSLL